MMRLTSRTVPAATFRRLLQAGRGSLLQAVFLLAHASPGYAAPPPTWMYFGKPPAASVSAIGWSAANPLDGYAVTTGSSTSAASSPYLRDLVYSTSDGGKIWHPASFAPGISVAAIKSVFVQPGNPDVVLLSEFDSSSGYPAATIWRSADAAKTWTKVYYNQSISNDFTIQMVPDSVNANTLYASSSSTYGSNALAVKSVDSGQTFAAIFGFAWPLLSIDQNGASVLYGVYNHSGGLHTTLVRSYDQGATEQLLTMPQLDQTEQFFGLAADPANSQIIYALTAFNYPPGTSQTAACRVLRTQDGGNTWSMLPSQGGIIARDCGPESIAVDPGNSAHIVIAQAWGLQSTPSILESFDTGKTWQGAKAPLQSVIGWQLSPQRPTVQGGAPGLWASTPQGAFVSPDGGDTWTLADVGMASPAVAQIVGLPGSSTEVFAATQGGVFKTDTAGPPHWLPSSKGLENLDVASIGIDVTSMPMVLYAATDIGLYKSIDSGRQWTRLSGPADLLGYYLVTADTKTPGLIYLAGNSNDHTGGGTPSWASHDGGMTWIPSPFTNQTAQGVSQILPDPDHARTVYEATSGTLIKSTNGGVTFSTVPVPPDVYGLTPPLTILRAHSGKPETIIADACNGHICASTDGGATWNQTGPGIPYIVYSMLAADPTGRRFFLGTQYAPFFVEMQTSADDGASLFKAGHGLPKDYIGPWATPHDLFATSFEDGAVYVLPFNGK